MSLLEFLPQFILASKQEQQPEGKLNEEVNLGMLVESQQQKQTEEQNEEGTGIEIGPVLRYT